MFNSCFFSLSLSLQSAAVSDGGKLKICGEDFHLGKKMFLAIVAMDDKFSNIIAVFNCLVKTQLAS